MQKHCVFLIILASFSTSLSAQKHFEPMQAPVSLNGFPLEWPFTGGMNSPQLSQADLNKDGLQDIVAFDRVGDVFSTWINKGVSGQAFYEYAPEYACNMPSLADFVLFRDYNKDGAADIFCSSLGLSSQEVSVFQGYYDGNVLKFKPYKFFYPACSVCDPFLIWYPDEGEPGSWNNLLVAKPDYPAVDDVDGDGDLDILTFDAAAGGYVWWYQNTSVENGFGLDSLQFRLADRCWGNFYESGLVACKNKLSGAQDTCAHPFAPTPSSDDRDGPHPGSTLMIYDQNGDGAVEIVLGDISFSCFNMMTNGGTKKDAWMVAQDTAFPHYNVPVDLTTFPAAFYFDVDNDGKKDFIAAPNSPNIVEDRKNVWFYKNTGTNSNHFFARQSTSLLNGQSIDLGSNSHPTFADVNGDGLWDLVVGNSGYFTPSTPNNASLHLFLNVGTPTQPAFKLEDDDWLNLSQYAPNDYDFAPAFGDLDGDGDEDLLVGSNIGSLRYYRNSAGEGNPMSLQQDFNTMWAVIDVGQAAVPLIYDLDGDGKKDILIGERTGNVNYFKNMGALENPVFGSTPTIQKLGAVTATEVNQVVGYSTPVILYTDNGPALLMGVQEGYFKVYSGLKASADPFPLLDGAWGGVDVGARSYPAIADIDGDGLMELVAGNTRGGLSLYKTVLKDCSAVSATEPGGRAQNLPVRIFPNPVQDYIYVQTDTEEVLQWRLYDALGRYLSAGNANTRIFDIELGRFPAGAYYLHLQSETAGTVKRVVKR